MPPRVSSEGGFAPTLKFLQGRELQPGEAPGAGPPVSREVHPAAAEPNALALEEDPLGHHAAHVSAKADPAPVVQHPVPGQIGSAPLEGRAHSTRGARVAKKRRDLAVGRDLPTGDLSDEAIHSPVKFSHASSAELKLVEPCVQPPSAEEIGVASLFPHPPFVKDEDPIRHPNGGQPVGDDKACPPREQPPHRLLD